MRGRGRAGKARLGSGLGPIGRAGVGVGGGQSPGQPQRPGTARDCRVAEAPRPATPTPSRRPPLTPGRGALLGG